MQEFRGFSCFFCLYFQLGMEYVCYQHGTYITNIVPKGTFLKLRLPLSFDCHNSFSCYRIWRCLKMKLESGKMLKADTKYNVIWVNLCYLFVTLVFCTRWYQLMFYFRMFIIVSAFSLRVSTWKWSKRSRKINKFI